MRKSFALLLMLAFSASALSQPVSSPRSPFERLTETRADLPAQETDARSAAYTALNYCVLPEEKVELDDVAPLSGAALVNYLTSKAVHCINAKHELFHVTPQTLALWSDMNVKTLAQAISERAPASNLNNQQGLQQLMKAIHIAYFVRSRSDFGEYQQATQDAVGSALTALTLNKAFVELSDSSDFFVDSIFMLADATSQEDRVVSLMVPYINTVLASIISGNRSFHGHALRGMFDILENFRKVNPPAWQIYIESQPVEFFEAVKKLAITSGRYNTDWLSFKPEESVKLFAGLLSAPSAKAWVENNTADVIAAYPRFSPPWLVLVRGYNDFNGDCARFGVCKETAQTELINHALPHSYQFDDGALVIKTSMSVQKARQLYFSMKEVGAQFMRVTKSNKPLADDKNPTLTIFLYDVGPDCYSYHNFINKWGLIGPWFGYNEHGGSLIICQDDRNNAELDARVGYAHYLIGRYLVPGIRNVEPLNKYGVATWFEAGLANLLLASTQSDGVAEQKITPYRPSNSLSVVLSNTVINNFGNVQSASLMYYLYTKKRAIFDSLVAKVKLRGAGAYDTLSNEILSEPDLESDYVDFSNEHHARYHAISAYFPDMPAYFPDTPAYDPEHFKLSSVAQVEAEFKKIIPGAQCQALYSASIARVACRGVVNTADGPEQRLNETIKALRATGVNNWRTLNCYHTVQSVSAFEYNCEVSIKDPAAPVKPNNKPLLTNKSTPEAYSGYFAATLSVDVLDLDVDDLFVGQWFQKSGPYVRLGKQYGTHVTAYTGLLPDVNQPQALVFEFVGHDGKDEVRLEHTLTIYPKSVNDPLQPIAKTNTPQVFEGDAVSLVGSIQDDKDVTFNWEQISGPAVELIKNGRDATFTAPVLTQNTSPLGFKLTATRWGKTASASVVVTVNKLFEIILSAPPEISSDEFVQMSARIEPVGAVNYIWEQIAGPQVMLNSNVASSVYFNPPKPAEDVVLTFRVSGSVLGKTRTKDISVTVKKFIPLTVSAVTATPLVEGRASVTLSSTVTSGTATRFYWTQTAGPSVSLHSALGEASFTAPAAAAGDQVLRFQVRAESKGQSASAEVSVTVKKFIPLGVRAFTATPNVDGGSQVTLQSVLTSGTARGYEWVQTAGPLVGLNSAGSDATFVAPMAAPTDVVLGFQIRAKGDGQSASAEVSVTVKRLIPLSIEVSTATPVVEAGTAVVLSSSVLTGTATAINWNQLEGPAVELAREGGAAKFIAPAAGESERVLTFRATAVGIGQTASADVSVTVKKRIPLLVKVATSTPLVEAGTLVTLSSAITSGTASALSWTQISGPAVQLNVADGQATFTAPAAAMTDTPLTFQLTAMGDGQSVHAEVTVTLKKLALLTVKATTATASVEGGAAVTLNSAVLTGQATNFVWQQFEGPSVSFENTGSDVTFTAPAAAATDLVLSFRVTAVGGPQTATADVSVTVKAKKAVVETPPPPPPPPPIRNEPAPASGGGGGGAVEWWLAAMLLLLAGQSHQRRIR